MFQLQKSKYRRVVEWKLVLNCKRNKTYFEYSFSIPKIFELIYLSYQVTEHDHAHYSVFGFGHEFMRQTRGNEKRRHLKKLTLKIVKHATLRCSALVMEYNNKNNHTEVYHIGQKIFCKKQNDLLLVILFLRFVKTTLLDMYSWFILFAQFFSSLLFPWWPFAL